MGNNIWTILKRELGAYFNSAIAVIYLIVFIVINNSLFMTRFFLVGQVDMRFYFETLPLVLLIFIPAISMRLWAEDKKENTFELLMTFPTTPAELVLGKFFAGLVFYSLSLVLTFTIPLILLLSGRPDLGVVLGGYLGAFFLGALFLAMGIFISGLTKEQIVAFILTMLSCFVFYFLGTDFVASFLDGWISGFGSFLKNYIGALSHAESFTKGVMDLKDILYFAVLGLVFLFLNGLYLEGRLRPRSKVVFGVTLAACFCGVVLFNWLIHDLPFGRFDLTENKVYTVSSASKKILGDLKAPVLVKVYITPAEKMPTALKTLEQELTSRLAELKIASHNKFKYSVSYIEAANLMDQRQKPPADPKAKEPLEAALSNKGIVPFQVESINKDEMGVKLVYSAITISYKEKGEEVLGRILPQNLPDLEYLLLSRIKKLTLAKLPKIALFSPLKSKEVTPEMAQMLLSLKQSPQQYEDDYQLIVPSLRNSGYEAVRVALSKENPLSDDIDVFLVINPGSLNDRQLYEINKFLVQGGSVLMAAEGYDYSFRLGPPAGLEVIPEKLSLDINKFLQKLGVKINGDLLMDENAQMINISTGQSVGPFMMTTPIKIPNQIIVTEETINKKMPLMSRLPNLFYLWGSTLEVTDDVLKSSGLKKSLMFSSGRRSWKVPFEGGPLKGESLQFPKAGAPGKFPCAMMLEGQFSDTFAQGGVPEWPSATAAPQAAPAKKEMFFLNQKPGKLVLIGCSKMFSDKLIVVPGNLILFSNIIDGLTLGDDVVRIRSKVAVGRDMKRLSDTQKIFFRFLAIFFVPLLLVLYASGRLVLRTKEKESYLAARKQMR